MSEEKQYKRGFKLKKVTDLSLIKEGDETWIDESDLSLSTGRDALLQFAYINETPPDYKRDKYPVYPGVFTIVKTITGLALQETNFTKLKLLTSYVHTAKIIERVNVFFDRVDVYEKRGIFPKRGLLFFGAPGTGKSATIAELTEQTRSRKDTLVVIWPTDALPARSVKDFVASFDYVNNPELGTVKRLIFIMEDLGGQEGKNREMASDSGLLALLDNSEQTFVVPTFIIATTNYPENFMQNLIDRPRRFDDKVEATPPSPSARAEFLKFFMPEGVPEADLAAIKDKKFDGLSVAHIEEIVIRADLLGITLQESMRQIAKESEAARNSFMKNSRMGFGD